MEHFERPTWWGRSRLLHVTINNLSLDELLSEIHASVLREGPEVISYVNIHAVNIAYSTPWFKEFLNKSHLTFCDGVGIKLAAKITGQQLRYRFTPPDFMDEICKLAVKFGWRIYFLGAKPGIAQRAADKLIAKLPGLQIQTHHGYFDKDIRCRENQQVAEQINQFQPQILVVGFGMPMQERWIEENISSLHINIAFPAGALFDYLSGELPRGPHWLTDHGFEWLARLLVEPRRLWKRYLIGNPLFFWRIFIHHYLGRPLPR